MRFAAGLEDVVPLALGGFILAGILAFVLTPGVRWVLRRFEVLDHPDARRVNEHPVPRGGGLAVMTAFFLAAVAALLANQRGAEIPPPSSIGQPELTALLAGGVLAGVVGGLDDYFQLRARWQLAGQLLVAVVAVVLGIGVGLVQNPLGGHPIQFDGVAGDVFTIVWIVGMINSINFIDGLDGLSSGIGLIAAITLGLISLTVTVDQPFVAILCFVLAGALLGFLRWNFHPASIFTGTSGVMFLGYTLALLSILGAAKVAVALLVLGVPIIDTFWNIVRRIATRRSPFSPDRGHIHHRLLDLGLSHTQTVLLIYSVCILLAVLALELSVAQQLAAFVAFVGATGFVLFVITRRSMDRGAKLS